MFLSLNNIQKKHSTSFYVQEPKHWSWHPFWREFSEDFTPARRLHSFTTHYRVAEEFNLLIVVLRTLHYVCSNKVNIYSRFFWLFRGKCLRITRKSWRNVSSVLKTWCHASVVYFLCIVCKSFHTSEWIDWMNGWLIIPIHTDLCDLTGKELLWSAMLITRYSLIVCALNIWDIATF